MSSTWLELQVAKKWEYYGECPDQGTVRVVTSLEELLHRTPTLEIALTVTQLLRQTDRAVTSCRLP